MLETDHALESLQDLWRRLGCKIELPEAEERFFSVNGIQASGTADQRQFPRYFYRNKAFLQYTAQWFPIFAKDLSHSSVGFLHCAQLFPCEKVQLCFLNGLKVNITIRRCRRLCRSCYECGGHIDAKDRLSPQIIRELIQNKHSPSFE
jgi:hypothetical protein